MAGLAILSDNTIRLDELRLESNNSYENAAAVTAAVTKIDGTSVASGITLSYVSGSDGKYDGTLQDTVVLVEGQDYLVTVTATSSGLKRTFRKRVTAGYDD